MGALYSAAADFEILAYDSIDSKEIPADCGADHVDDGVNRSNFVEVDLVCFDTMDGAFSFCKGAEAGD
jgi:hypothetical protein